MPKSITATDIVVESLSIQTDEVGTVVGLTANINVAYGEARVREQLDLWTQLTLGQQVDIQAIYDMLKQHLQTTYLS